jgi:hypothetical protein
LALHKRHVKIQILHQQKAFMKKLFTLAMLLVATFASKGQFFDPTSYKGAFAPAPTAMWTDGWCNWTPDSTNYPATTVTISGTISSNTTWTSNQVYKLSGVVYVDSLVTLTIQPGTIIRGDNSVANSSLIVKRGGKLLAQGTATNPIVFTSNQPVGSRTLGDWGGVILLGKARMNQGFGFIEGLAAVNEHMYGGNDDLDNSGILSYVRIEYGGYVFAQNKEINGLTMGAVGSGTQIDHIQVSYVNDDAFEWYGGTVNAKYLVSYRNLDDDFDTDFGYSGKVQFGLSVRDPQIADPSFSLPSGASTSEGFESDNDANGSYLLPRTSATFSNFTMIGPFRGNNASTVHPAFRRGARIRRNSALKIINSVISDWATGFMLDGVACENNALANSPDTSLLFQNNIIANYRTRAGEVASGRTFDILGYIGQRNDTLKTNGNLMVRPYDFTNPDYRPALNSPMSTMAMDLNPIQIYPNPSNGNVQIQFESNQGNSATIQVIDMMGKVQVLEKIAISGNSTESFDWNHLPTGMYLVQISTGRSIRMAKLQITE